MMEDMDVQALQEVTSLITCRIMYDQREATISSSRETMKENVIKEFNFQNRETVLLQTFAPEWDDWIDVTPCDITDQSTLKVLVIPAEEPQIDHSYVAVTDNQEPTETGGEDDNVEKEVGDGYDDGVEGDDENDKGDDEDEESDDEGDYEFDLDDEEDDFYMPSDISYMPSNLNVESVCRRIVSFHLERSCRPSHKNIMDDAFNKESAFLRFKLQGCGKFYSSEKKQLFEILVNVITWFTYCPTREQLMKIVEDLLRTYPVLYEDKPKEAKAFWTNQLEQRLHEFQEKADQLSRQQRADKAAQTEMMNKPWQIWHPGDHQNIAGAKLQDMTYFMSEMKKQLNKAEPDMVIIMKLMRLTFPYRRSFILNNLPDVKVIHELYPALFNCDEIRKEFLRIAGMRSDKSFARKILQYSRAIYELSGKSPLYKAIESSVEAAKKANQPFNWHSAAMLLLPFLLKEKLSFLWFKNEKFRKKELEPYIKCNTDVVGTLQDHAQFEVYAANIIVAKTDELVIAVECLLSCFYVFQIEYPHNIKRTLQMLQTFFFEYVGLNEAGILPSVHKLSELLKSKVCMSQ